MQKYTLYKVLEFSKSKVKLEQVQSKQVVYHQANIPQFIQKNLIIAIVNNEIVDIATSRYTTILKHYRDQKKFLKMIEGSPFSNQYLSRLNSQRIQEIYKSILVAKADSIVVPRLIKSGLKKFTAKVKLNLLLDFKEFLKKLQECLAEHNMDIRYFQQNEFMITGTYNEWVLKPYKLLNNILSKPFPTVEIITVSK